MKKILIANDLLKGGGVENVLDNLVRYLLERGNSVSLMIPGCTQNQISDFFGSNVKIQSYICSLKKAKRFSPAWFINRCQHVFYMYFCRLQIFFKQYDVIIALKEGPIMRQISKLHAKKKIAWVHTDYNYMHWTKSCFHSDEEERKCMMKFDKVVCVSKASADSVIQTIGDSGNLCVKYNPLDYERIIEKAQQPCPIKRETTGPLFVSIGRLTSQKNYTLLLEVCAELEKKYDFELWIVGDGRDRQALEQMIQTHQIKSVKLLGNQSNPYPFIKAADVFVSSAVWESFGLAIQEALILGVPVVTTECPAIREVFDTRFGVMVGADSDNLYAAMEKIILQPERCEEYRENIKQYYNLDDLYEKRLESICTLWEE